MNIKRNYLFFVDKEGNKDVGYKPDGKLRLRIRFNGKKVDFNVGYRVEVEKWINEAQRCKAGTTHGKKKSTATDINKEIQRLADLAESVFKECEVNNHIPTIAEYREMFNEVNGKQADSPNASKITFFSVFDEFVKNTGIQNQWTKATYTKFNSVRTHLFNYNDKLDLDTISERDLSGFLLYLRTVVQYREKEDKNGEKKKFVQCVGLRNTTIANYVSFVKWFLRWAYDKDYYNGKLHSSWKPKLKGTDGNQKEVIHLTWDELISLYNYEVPTGKNYLERVKDVFCFCCFTSLRYSDVAKLSRSDIKEGYISIVTQKTVDGLKIELNKYSKSILDKYKDFAFPKDKALPVISNVKMNEYLKELGELAGLSEPQRIVYFKGSERIEEVYPKYALLTTHCGRRTFIVNALYLGIPAEVVMRWTGHSDYKAMKPYVKIVDDLKEKEMNKFNLM